MWLSDALSSKRITKPYSEPIQTVLYSDKGMFPFLLCGSQENSLRIGTFPYSNRTRNRTRTAPDHLCHATAVALHRRRIFRLLFSQCRTRIALHPLKCLKKGPVAPFCRGCRTLSWPCIYHQIVSRYRGCRSYSVASHATLRH